MSLPADLKDRADAALADLAAQLATLQPAYHAEHGRYWQGLRTHARLPADGVAAAPDRRRRPPGGHSWAGLGIALPATMAFALEVHTYQGPDGDGYDLIASLQWEGQVTGRILSFGPEAGRRRAGWEG